MCIGICNIVSGQDANESLTLRDHAKASYFMTENRMTDFAIRSYHIRVDPACELITAAFYMQNQSCFLWRQLFLVVHLTLMVMVYDAVKGLIHLHSVRHLHSL